MRNSRRWSNASAPCRLDWRPSRLLAGVLIALGMLGAVSVLMSALPASAAWLLAAASLIEGARLARRELASPPRTLLWPIGATPSLDREPMHDPQLHWRGPLAFLAWRDGSGRRRRLVWWPDTLDAAGRRELRLAAMGTPAVAADRSMAP